MGWRLAEESWVVGQGLVAEDWEPGWEVGVGSEVAKAHNHRRP